MVKSKAEPKIKIDENLTRKVADLARLALSDSEVTTFTSQLGEILKYMDTLHEVNVEGINPMVHPFELPTLLRADHPNPFPTDKNGKPKVLSSAPDVLHNGFKVPPIM
jgi:aspartyl-tRNA(Asn)/glutamyl-tRNA(Gln) amidotransferase subunit C